jgi:hypothetical protein
MGTDNRLLRFPSKPYQSSPEPLLMERCGKRPEKRAVRDFFVVVLFLIQDQDLQASLQSQSDSLLPLTAFANLAQLETPSSKIPSRSLST